jgi:tetratricopeptide (TPR) repeat protein
LDISNVKICCVQKVCHPPAYQIVTSALDNAMTLKLDGPGLRITRYQLAFFQNDNPVMQEQVSWFGGKPGVQDQMLTVQSDTEAYHGRLAKARELSQRAVEVAKHNESPESAAVWQVNAALREAEFGNTAAARKGVAESLALSSGRDIRLLAALTLARGGDKQQAQRLADRISQEAPLDTLIQAYWLPTIRAELELNGGDAKQALQVLQATSPYDLGSPQPFQLATLYPVYSRGKAYLKAGQGQKAQAEFQKIIDHRGLSINFPLGALAHLQLARAYAVEGDTPKARTSYQDFFALWKDADPDIPILTQAKAEYARLQ